MEPLAGTEDRWDAWVLFERFTPEARAVLTEAQAESREMRHNYVGLEHLLLGLLREHDSAAAQTLRSLGLSTDRVRGRVKEIVRAGEHDPPPGMYSPLVPQTKRVLELALRESLRLGRHEIGPECILLALVREDDGVAMRILLEFVDSPEQIREAMLQRLPALVSEAGRVVGRPIAIADAAIRVTHSPQVSRLLMSAGARALDDGRTQIEINDVLLALGSEPAAAGVLAELSLDENAIWTAIERRADSGEPPDASAVG